MSQRVFGIVPLFGADRLRAEVWFNQMKGWEWRVSHWDGEDWCILDSGLTRSYNAALHRVQETIGQLDSAR